MINRLKNPATYLFEFLWSQYDTKYIFWPENVDGTSREMT